MRFAMTYCSMCGCETGPGDEGYSSCADHMADLEAHDVGAAANDPAPQLEREAA